MKKSIFDCKHIECCMDGCYCKINEGSGDWNICSKPCKYWEKKPSEAYMTSPIGDLPINSKGLRIAIDEIVRLKRELNKKLKREFKYNVKETPKECQINDIAKIIFERGVALEGIDFVYGLVGSDHFDRIARAIYNAGYRNCKETARVIYKKGKELDENFDMTGLGEYIIANFLSEENEK